MRNKKNITEEITIVLDAVKCAFQTYVAALKKKETLKDA